MDDDLLKQVFNKIRDNEAFARGMARATKKYFNQLSPKHQTQIIEIVETNPLFAQEFN